MQNFSPKAIVARLMVLEKEAVTAIEGIPADLEARLTALEEAVEKLLPILPLLQKQNAGEVAGKGASETTGTVIPATELGTYDASIKAKS